MTNKNETKAAETLYQKPKGSTKTISYANKKASAICDWIVLEKDNQPHAEMFYTYYTFGGKGRPVTFLFNGGPGASSVYLHLGAVGPYKTKLDKFGEYPASPATIIENKESWLAFTDLVFVDPVGTGWSRDVLPKKEGDKPSSDSEFYAIEKDLDSLGAFICQFLSTHERWLDPVFIAGESYGGFRVGHLAHRLQNKFGVGLSGAILISPALETNFFDYKDYTVLPWIDHIPSMALSAQVLGKSRTKGSAQEIIKQAKDLAVQKLGPIWTDPTQTLQAEKEKAYKQLADLIGLPAQFVIERHGRIDPLTFAKELLKSEHRLVSMYDATATKVDPFPHKPHCFEQDGLLDSERLYAPTINHYLRQVLGVKTDRNYNILSMEINGHWKQDKKKSVFATVDGASDQVRLGLASNPQMHVFFTHGLYDLVTPFFSTDRIVGLMTL
ncbi:MAG: peptidase S10, partial [Deltaproteobacteria bacterium]|nr:peptidase S10 [Deltaproteobacteria bacterium]